MIIQVGTPLAGTYTIDGQKTTDYTGVVEHVDIPHEGRPALILVTIRFHGGRREHYVTDMHGHSVDTGMTPTPCPGPHDPVTPMTCTRGPILATC